MVQAPAVINDIESLRKAIRSRRSDDPAGSMRVGLVPTMGALHEGHLSLARQAKEQCGLTVVSIFVNPTQFAPGEDLAKYPRTLEQDVAMLGEVGVDLVFHPGVEEMYPGDCSTTVVPPSLATQLEGEFRSTHFAGVCTIVLKLLNAVQSDAAYFGQKDFQQAAVIKQMVADLNVEVEIEVCPIVRDKDGLALSSRNRYLNEEQREIALALNRTLQYVADEIRGGETDGHLLMAEMRQRLIDAGVTSVDYAAICDPKTLTVLDQIAKPAVALIASHVGETRLIDNLLID